MKIAIVAVKKGKCLCGQSEVSYASKAEANCYTVEPSLCMGGRGGGRWNSSCIFDDSMARPPTFKIVTNIKLFMRWIQSCSIIFQTPVEKKSFRQIIPARPRMIWTNDQFNDSNMDNTHYSQTTLLSTDLLELPRISEEEKIYFYFFKNICGNDGVGENHLLVKSVAKMLHIFRF